MHFFPLVWCFFAFFELSRSEISSACSGNELEFTSQPVLSRQPKIWHSAPLEFNYLHAFSDLYVVINVSNADDYTILTDNDCDRLLSKKSPFHFSLFEWLAQFFTFQSGKVHDLSLFNDTYVYIESSSKYEIYREVMPFTPYRVCFYAAGVLIYIYADRISHNCFTYYVGGASVGILASVLIVLYILSRFLPRRMTMIAALGGSGAFIYLRDFVFNYLAYLATSYPEYFVAYIVICLSIFIAITYIWEPYSNPRVPVLLSVFLRGVGFASCYFSSQINVVPLMTFGVLFLTIFPFKLGSRFGLRICRSNSIPSATPYVKRLSKKEYEEEGRRCTREEMRKLRRTYIRRPELQLRAQRINRSIRFDKFLDGSENDITDSDQRLYDEIYSRSSGNEDSD